MSRRFQLHEHRVHRLLDGLWDFTFLGDAGLDEIHCSELDFDETMAVPGCFDATPRYAARQGVAAYRKRFSIDDETPHRLVFEGVNHRCRIFVAGERVAAHDWGFSEFRVELCGLRPGPTELVVLVDNRVGAPYSSMHQPHFDWYSYGGITRSVRLERLGELWIDALELTTQSIQPPRLGLRLRYAATAPRERARLVIRIDGEPRQVETVSLLGTSGVLERSIDLPGAKLWSPDAPNLLHCQVELDGDDYCQRVGLRKIERRGSSLLLNDQPLILRGVNRHQSHPELGHAVSDALELGDVQLIRELGANFVRSSHYPMNLTFLDLCDETGLVVWNESLGWQHGRADLESPAFLAAQEQHIEEMVAMSRNHASVLFWGILNESASHEPGSRPAYARLLGRLRELDASRLVTYASMYRERDVCFDLCDVMSVNCYPGWYHGELSDIPRDLDQMLAKLTAMQPDKPLIVSEIGAAGLYGWHDWHHGRWSEDYQAELLERALGHLYADGRVAGVAIWQFCDMRTSDMVTRIMGRPRGFNNKGLVDEYRRPKAAFAAVRKLFRRLAERAQPAERGLP